MPVNAEEADSSAVTLGVKFWSAQPGTVPGIRFYRGHTNNSGYTVRLYTAAGSLVAQATTAHDTCTVPCWEQVNFATPISISAKTTYVAAYYTSNGYYADGYYGLTKGATNGPLVAPASGVSGGNGVYVYGYGTVTNTGLSTISSQTIGVNIQRAGTVSNLSGGVITGTDSKAVYIRGYGPAGNQPKVLVYNAGLLQGYSGVEEFLGGSVTNVAGGTILGQDSIGVFLENSSKRSRPSRIPARPAIAIR